MIVKSPQNRIRLVNRPAFPAGSILAAAAAAAAAQQNHQRLILNYKAALSKFIFEK